MFDSMFKISCDSGKILTIMYQKGENITKRNIRVVKIGKDTLRAFCLLRNQSRVFRKDSILAVELYRKQRGG